MFTNVYFYKESASFTFRYICMSDTSQRNLICISHKCLHDIDAWEFVLVAYHWSVCCASGNKLVLHFSTHSEDIQHFLQHSDQQNHLPARNISSESTPQVCEVSCETNTMNVEEWQHWATSIVFYFSFPLALITFNISFWGLFEKKNNCFNNKTNFQQLTQGHSVLLEPVSGVIGQRQGDTMDESPIHHKATYRQRAISNHIHTYGQ